MHATDFLGRTMRDRVTGFTGVATGVVFYLTGCNQVLLTPPVGEDGKARDAGWYDQQRLAEVALVARVVLDNGTAPGFDVLPPGY